MTTNHYVPRPKGPKNKVFTNKKVKKLKANVGPNKVLA